MDPDRRQRLEALPGWSWDRFSDQWEEGFLSSESSFQNERVIAECLSATRPTMVIGSVSGLQFREATKDTMEPDRRQRLEALPGWSWDVLSDQWEEGFSHLKAVFRTRGSLPSVLRLQDRRRLSARSWVSNQRTDKDTMEPDRRQRLRHCRVGHGMLIRINGKRASLI